MPHKQNTSRTSSRSTAGQSKATSQQTKARIPPTQTTDPCDDQSHRQSTDPSEPPNYDYSKDRGRRLRLRQGEQCVFNHSMAEKSPLLDLKQWREKLRALRALPKPNSDVTMKRPRHKPHKGSATTPRVKRPGLVGGGGRKITANVPGAGVADDDGDMVAFGDILNPTITADNRYDRYLEEIQGRDRDDLDSLCNEPTRPTRDNIHVAQHKIQRKDSGANVKDAQVIIADGDAAVNMADMMAKHSLSKRQALARSQSVEPMMSVAGNHGLLHDKPKTESRLSLNNFKLRHQLSEDMEAKQPAGSSVAELDSAHKHQTVIDSARLVNQGVKIANYVTKQPFSPRRLNTTNIHRDVLYDVRRESLHLPLSTSKNAMTSQRTRATVPATKATVAENKGGGWRVAQAKRDIDYNRLIPVSVTDSGNISGTPPNVWKYKT